MDIVLPFLACLVLGAPIGLAGSVLIGRGPQLMAGLFGGNHGLGWPQGMQEEDPPGGWTWRLPAASGSAEAGVAATGEESREAALSDDSSLDGDRPVVRPIKPQMGRGTNRLHSRW
jgi:hypothetical protein